MSHTSVSRMSRHKTRSSTRPGFNIVPYRCAAQPHARQPGPEPAAAAAGSSRFLFVEVHGPHRTHRQALRYDRSTQELKSHVMLVTSERKRKSRAKDDEDHAAQSRPLPPLPPHCPPGIISDIDTHLIDPFDVLPIEGSPRLHEAMRYFFENYPGPTPMTDDVFVCDRNRYKRERVEWNNTEYHLCYGEPAGYYITLFVYDILQNLATSADHLSMTASKYLTATIRAVREGMPKEGSDTPITDSFVATVGGLSVVEVFIGHWAEAESHMNGMLALVAARGGIFTFSHLAQRTIKWIEFLCCAANACAPTLPPLPRFPLPAQLEEMARDAHRRSMALLPRVFSEDKVGVDDDEDDEDDDVLGTEADDYYYYAELGTILRELHEVSIGSTLFRGKAVAAALDDVEHRLLEEMVRRRQLHQQRLVLQHHALQGSPASLVDNVVSVDTVFDAVLQSAQMYVWAALNPGPREMAAHFVFVGRLREILDDAVPDRAELVERWVETTGSADSLLWVLFVGWGVSSQQQGDVKGAMSVAMWYVERVLETMDAVGVLRSEEDLADVLKRFPWVDGFCRGPCGVLWHMYVHRESSEYSQFQS
ncbi:tachykinin family protein [Diplodia corticola]|uniref:Tachykinin family protein n=1 Tax=Diplodia corticola TaxID=236234 RepID=A0A1J9RSZ2_9PEZI|nr:tachykinin family protein [Diplodia corticola]OJD30653.1 tachykinin family protein [Diplodia corticola]